MDIETFVHETLRQVVAGVLKAQNDPDCKDVHLGLALTNAPLDKIEFDLATTVVAGNEKEGNGSIRLASVLSLGGKVAASESSSTVHRVRFTVPVMFPSKMAKRRWAASQSIIGET